MQHIHSNLYEKYIPVVLKYYKWIPSTALHRACQWALDTLKTNKMQTCEKVEF